MSVPVTLGISLVGQCAMTLTSVQTAAPMTVIRTRRAPTQPAASHAHATRGTGGMVSTVHGCPCAVMGTKSSVKRVTTEMRSATMAARRTAMPSSPVIRVRTLGPRAMLDVVTVLWYPPKRAILGLIRLTGVLHCVLQPNYKCSPFACYFCNADATCSGNGVCNPTFTACRCLHTQNARWVGPSCSVSKALLGNGKKNVENIDVSGGSLALRLDGVLSPLFAATLPQDLKLQGGAVVPSVMMSAISPTNFLTQRTTLQQSLTTQGLEIKGNVYNIEAQNGNELYFDTPVIIEISCADVTVNKVCKPIYLNTDSALAVVLPYSREGDFITASVTHFSDYGAGEGDAVCGDSKLEVGEVCDDGNTAGGDGCAADCSAVEAGYTCSGGTPTSADTCITTCGDGLRAGVEVCDDGNVAGSDGCSLTCTIEPGFTCAGGSPTAADTCITTCGDGLRAGAEVCDDSNTASGDGCSVGCTTEPGYTCAGGSPTSVDICITTCGDGLRAGTETCDDSNTASGDGCSVGCTTEPGYTCAGGTPTSADTCGTTCGDGKRAGSEACDDGNSASSDGCSATCTTEVGYSCSGGTPSTIDVCIVICGDGKRVGIEVCDDGNEVALDGCSATCTTEIGYTCSGGSLTVAGHLRGHPVRRRTVGGGFSGGVRKRGWRANKRLQSAV